MSGARVWTVEELDRVHPLPKGWGWRVRGTGPRAVRTGMAFHMVSVGDGGLTTWCDESDTHETPTDVVLAVILVHKGLDSLGEPVREHKLENRRESEPDPWEAKFESDRSRLFAGPPCPGMAACLRAAETQAWHSGDLPSEYLADALQLSLVREREEAGPAEATVDHASAGRPIVSGVAFVQFGESVFHALAFRPAGLLVAVTAANAATFALEVWKMHGCPQTPEESAEASEKLAKRGEP